MRWMTASWMGWGPFCKVPNIHRCTAQSSVPSSHLHVSSHNFNFILALTLITMIIITMIHTVTCHVSLGKYSPCHWANTGRVYEKVEFVSGVDQENVLLGQYAVQAWTPLGRAVRTRVTIATMQDIRQIVVNEWNAIPQQRCSVAQ